MGLGLGMPRRYHEVAASAMRHCEVLLQGVAGVSPSADTVYTGRASGTVVAVGHGASPVFVKASQQTPSSDGASESPHNSTTVSGWASRRRVALSIDFVDLEVCFTNCSETCDAAIECPRLGVDSEALPVRYPSCFAALLAHVLVHPRFMCGFHLENAMKAKQSKAKHHIRVKLHAQACPCLLLLIKTMCGLHLGMR
jgi:hypothetical protein